MGERTAFNERGILPINGVKPPHNEKNNGLWGSGREEDVTHVIEHTVSIIEKGRGRTSRERNGKLIQVINDLGGRGVGYDDFDEYWDNTVFGGVALRDAVDKLDTQYALAAGGSTSIYNTGPEPLYTGDEVMYGGPTPKDPKNIRAYINNPQHPDLQHNDIIANANGWPNGKTFIQTLRFDPKTAIGANRIYNNGVKEGTAEIPITAAMKAYDANTISHGTILLAEMGIVTINRTALDRQNAQQRFDNANGAPGSRNSVYESLVHELFDGMEAPTVQNGFREGTGRQLRLIDRVQRRKFARDRHSVLIRGSSADRRKAKIRKNRNMKVVPRFLAAMGTAYHKTRARVFGRILSTAERGELADVLITTIA